jgi:hypothetical protein
LIRQHSLLSHHHAAADWKFSLASGEDSPSFASSTWNTSKYLMYALRPYSESLPQCSSAYKPARTGDGTTMTASTTATAGGATAALQRAS